MTNAGEQQPDFTFCMHASDAPHLAVLEGLLRGAGIAYFVKNEATTSLWGHSLSAAFVRTPAEAPALWVDTSRLDEARLLLTPDPASAGDGGGGR